MTYFFLSAGGFSNEVRITTTDKPQLVLRARRRKLFLAT